MGYLAKYLTATLGTSLAAQEKFAFETWLTRVAPGRDETQEGRLDLKFSSFADLQPLSFNGQVEFDLLRRRLATYVLGMQMTLSEEILLNL